METCLLIDPYGDLQAALLAPLTRCGLAMDVALNVHRADTRRHYTLVAIDLRGRVAFDDDACVAVRKRWQASVLAFIDPRDAIDKVLALEMGADALVAPPFSSLEVEARLRSLLRRTMSPATPRASEMVNHMGGVLDADIRRLCLPGQRLLNLSASECMVLEALMAQPGQAMSRGELLARAGLAGLSRNPNIVDLAVSRLRQKLSRAGIADALIETVRGHGYAWHGLAD